MTLQEILTPELYTQVQARIDEVNAGQTDKTKHVRFADLSEGKYVSTDKFNSKIDALTGQINDLNGQITKRDADLAELQGKLTAAQTDGAKLAEAQAALTALQGKYDADTQAAAARMAQQAYEFDVRERANALKFTSGAAKKTFIQEAINKKFAQQDGKLLGFDDFVSAYRDSDPGAFVVEAAPPEVEQDPAPTPAPAPQIVMPTGGPTKPAADPNGFHFNFSGVRPKPQE